CVKTGSAVSDPQKIIRGVPEGSVASPLLFALAIASLPAAARVGEEPAYPISVAFMPTTWHSGYRLSWGPEMREVLQKMRAHTNSPDSRRNYLGNLITPESRINSVENLMQDRALGHLARMRNCDSTITLLTRIAERAESRLGAHLCAPQKESHPLRISLHIPGLRTKKYVAAVVARQLKEDNFVTQYDGWTQVYTDGSVDPSGGTATAAAFFQPAGVGTSEGLFHQASSTTEELAAIRLALWGIRTGRTEALRWVILSDSRSALELLSRLERTTPLAPPCEKRHRPTAPGPGSGDGYLRNSDTERLLPSNCRSIAQIPDLKRLHIGVNKSYKARDMREKSIRSDVRSG
ncbi:hypothetical protein HPB47_022253, partial [Ixodes persulcatus]